MKLLNKLALWSAAIAGVVAIGSPSAQAIVNVIDATDGQANTYFTPTDSQKFNAPYYRWHDEDWGWTHDPIASGWTTAKLGIDAFDIDFSSGERDNISIFTGLPSAPVLIGTLVGANDAWAYTEFVLPNTPDMQAALAAGLRVWMDIDSTHNFDNWAVALAKSVITTDGGIAPLPGPGTPIPPQPETNVPDGGATSLLLGIGAVALGLAQRRR